MDLLKFAKTRFWVILNKLKSAIVQINKENCLSKIFINLNIKFLPLIRDDIFYILT